MHSISVIHIQISEWVQRNVSRLHEIHQDTIHCHTESALITHATSNGCRHLTGINAEKLHPNFLKELEKNGCCGCGVVVAEKKIEVEEGGGEGRK